MFLVPFFDLQNFILLVRTVPFLRKIFFISSYTAKNNYFLLYELIQDLPYPLSKTHESDYSVWIFFIFLVCLAHISTGCHLVKDQGPLTHRLLKLTNLRRPYDELTV